MAAIGASMAIASTAEATPPRSVSYLGHTFAVPAGWSLVDLRTNPTACVRFDVHAVYVGTPSTEQKCAASGGGAVRGAVLIAPSPTARTARATDDSVEQRITATLPGIEITASYGSDRTSVVALLTAAGVPKPSVTSGVTAKVTPIQGPVTASLVATMTESYRGLGFDACAAPSTSDMTSWGKSPFSAIGVYIGGAGRACTQPNLTASWVSTETAAGWHLLPLYVGPQVAYNTITSAAAQGISSAQDAANQASSLGIGKGAVLYYDMEGGSYTTAESATAQTFLAAWTTELHTLGYHSAVYGSETGAIGAMTSDWGKVTEPDILDVANWNSQADDDPGADTANHWTGHRVHQFEGDANATYGGVTINIDQDYFGLARPCPPITTPGSPALPLYRENCSALPIPSHT
ncbi:MAG TPA: glycoside hydrolase domain-containing protein [Actinospica sp.]|nr:glycoside hydrolase domain-containing protein [Actinospica sp.]